MGESVRFESRGKTRLCSVSTLFNSYHEQLRACTTSDDLASCTATAATSVLEM